MTRLMQWHAVQGKHTAADDTGWRVHKFYQAQL